jgi:hypothetical protein
VNINLINDVKKLIGLRLHSIRPGAEITIISVDEDMDNLTLRTASGQMKSRPLRELREIWKQLQVSPVVHVDEVLHGSGTSRNQPETILANLPYIEWLKVNGKKNIAFVGKETHPYGTIQMMDAIAADKLLSKGGGSKTKAIPKFVIVTANIKETFDFFRRRCSGNTMMLGNGVYCYQTKTENFIVTVPIQNLLPGTYAVLAVDSLPKVGNIISIANKNYEVSIVSEIKVLMVER